MGKGNTELYDFQKDAIDQLIRTGESKIFVEDIVNELMSKGAIVLKECKRNG